MRKVATWHSIQDQLVARRTCVNEEIAAYPSPVAGCDAQFNHLLEERSGISAQLARLERERTKGADTGSLGKFIETCPFLGESGGEKQQ